MCFLWFLQTHILYDVMLFCNKIDVGGETQSFLTLSVCLTTRLVLSVRKRNLENRNQTLQKNHMYVCMFKLLFEKSRTPRWLFCSCSRLACLTLSNYGLKTRRNALHFLIVYLGGQINIETRPFSTGTFRKVTNLSAVVFQLLPTRMAQTHK